MKLTEQELRHIIKDELNKLLLEEIEPLKGDGATPDLAQGGVPDVKGIKTLAQKVRNTPHLQSDIQNTVKKIVTSSDILANLEKITQNPVAAATFITQLMGHLNLNPKSYSKLLADISESKQSCVVSTLNSCVKLLKYNRNYDEN